MANSHRRHDQPSADLAADIVESAQQLVRLEIALAKREVKELAISNGIAAGALAGAALFALTAVLVALPVWLVVVIPQHAVAAAVWFLLYLLLAIGLALLGRSRLAIRMPQRTIQSLKETKAWLLHQISSSSR